MINYMQTNILDMLEYVGEDNCKNILSTFVCPLNSDVERSRKLYESHSPALFYFLIFYFTSMFLHIF